MKKHQQARVIRPSEIVVDINDLRRVLAVYDWDYASSEDEAVRDRLLEMIREG